MNVASQLHHNIFTTLPEYGLKKIGKPLQMNNFCFKISFFTFLLLFINN